MNTAELHNVLLRLTSLSKESEYVEYKENNFSPEEIGKRISALSNGAALFGQKYGYLVFGVEDGTHAIVGTGFQPTASKVGNEELEHWLSQRLNPRIDFRIFPFEYQYKNIVLFQIPAAYTQPTTFQHISYVRIGSITRSLKDFPDKERKLWQRDASEFELDIAKGNVSAANVVALLNTQSVFDLLLKTPYPTTQDAVIQKLLDEKLITRNNGHFNITNLGALLFAKKLDQFGLERKAPRVIKYKGNNKFSTEKDLLGQLGYGNGFERLLDYVSGLLPSNEVIEKAIRMDVQVYPPLAVRELIANALIHQDLRTNSTFLTVEIYENRIEISNPGLPIIEPNRFMDGYNSRNILLGNAMRRMGFCEEKGSGIDKVIHLCEVFQLPAPDFRTINNQTISILFSPQKLAEMNSRDKVRATYQHCCLMYLSNQKMSNQTLRNRFKLEENKSAIASRIIKDTLIAGLIKQENIESKSKKYQSYIPYWA